MDRTRATARAPRRIRKTMDIDGAKLEAARRVLGARTDTDTVDQALDYVAFQAEVFAALDALAAAGGLEPSPEPAMRRASAPKRAAERRRG